MFMDPQWFHITAHTYGAWLHGDPKSFRTRHHREHVVGDYKNPPPDMYAAKLARSRVLLKQDPVRLEPNWWPIIGAAVRDKLIELGTRLLALSQGATHMHCLGKMPGGPVPREWVGRAKVASNFKAKEHGYTGKLWAVRCKVNPIKDRPHQINTFFYILNHIKEGAWVWDYRDPDNPRITPDSGESPGPYGPGLSEGERS
jgi:hypothetical protein